MKRLVPFLLALFCLFGATAQRSPEEIRQIITRDFEEISTKYDTKEAYDTLLQRTNDFLTEAEGVLKKKPTKEIHGEVALWHNVKAHLLYGFYDMYCDPFSMRTEIENPDLSDPKTWAANTFLTKILEEYYESLRNKDILTNIPSKDYIPLFKLSEEKEYYATLYDLLAYNFAEQLQGLFNVNGTAFLSQAAFFDVLLPAIETQDTATNGYHFLKLMKEIEEVHLPDAACRYTLYNRMVRIDYVYDRSLLYNKDSLYLAALMRMVNEAEFCVPSLKQLFLEKTAIFYHNRGLKSADYPDDFLTAIHWYEKAVEVDSGSVCARHCKDNIFEIKRNDYAVSIPDETLYPEDNLIRTFTKNCDSLCIIVAKPAKLTGKNRATIKLDIIQQLTIPTRNTNLYRTDTTLAILPALPTGEYILLATTFVPKFITEKQYTDWRQGQFTVTRLSARYNDENGASQLIISDQKTGEPLSNVQVKIAGKDARELYIDATRKTNSDGIAFFDKKTLGEFKFFTLVTLQSGDDILHYNISGFYRHYYDNKYEDLTAKFFTDRAVYRPGQKVEWKAVVRSISGDDERLLPNASIVVEFTAQGGQLIQRDTMKTNSFGSVAGTFQIPQTGSLGTYSIKMFFRKNWVGDKRIRVEEYKRPTFDAVLSRPDSTFKLGAEVSVHGTATAYAGYAVQGAKVAYSVTYTASFPFRYYGWWRTMPYIPSREIASGECTTDANGRFTIRFTAEDGKDYESYLPLYCYSVKTTVTDISGETHEATTTVYVSQRSLQFHVTMPKCLRPYRGETEIAVRAENLAGEPQRTKVDYTVTRLALPDHYRMKAPFTCANIDKTISEHFPQFDFNGENEIHQWAETGTVASGNLITSDTSILSIPNISSLESGAYKLNLSTVDAFGETVEEVFFFYIAQKEKDFPIYTPLDINVNNTNAYVGETVIFTIGSYLENQPVFIRISNNDKLLEQKWIRLSKGVYQYRHPIKKGEEGTFTCEAFTYWERDLHKKEAVAFVQDIQRTIQFDFLTFRDKLQPGGQETVKIRLKDGSGATLSKAELLCTLYDASLDAFAANSFPSMLFTLQKPQPHLTTSLYSDNYYHSKSFHSLRDYYIKRDNPRLPAWNTTFSTPYHIYYNAAAGRTIDGILLEEANVIYSVDHTRSATVTSSKKGKRNKELEAASVYYARWEATEDSGIEDMTGGETSGIFLRSNFNETAFFYPFLTVKDGVVEFEYTVPESLTKWKMLGAAHTAQRQYGTFEKFVVTQKPLMVSPNLPRFVYAGDQWEFAVKIVNLSGERLEGEVDIQFRDADDGSVILADKREVRLDSGATELIQEFVLIPEGFAGVTYVVTVEASGGGNTYSDGETGDVPVLSREQIVTEALPLFITKKGNRTFSLKNLPAASNNIISCKLQFTPDARWNAILALPYLMEYPYDCNEQLFSKLYANTVAAHIAEQNPNFQSLLKNAMEQQPEALRSKLVQNSDLKQILLAETPWVADAMDEDNEIQNLNCLFEKQNITEQRKAMVQKLERNQNADGGWSWFSSRYNEKSSRYITQHLLIGSGRLIDKGICKASDNFLSESTLDKAIRFIDEDEQKEYTEMEKEHPEWLDIGIVTSSELHYLYARSFFLKKRPAKTEAYRFYKRKLVKGAQNLDGIYLKTMAALTLWQCNEPGDRELAKQLMNGIKKRAIHSEEMGMYWKKEGYGLFWYEAPIERQALLIEAFQTILQDEESVREMKIWLLQQKRTQHWSSTRSTADACYALLLDNDLTHPDPTKHITVSLCGETIDFVDTMQLPMKQDIAACVEKGSNGTVTLTRDTDGLSYGGVFVRYYKDIDEIEGTGRGMPMSVERQLYKVTTGESGEVLTELGAGGALQVGDRVRVRMVLRADRDLEFVHLKDLRAAAFEPTETLSGYRWQDGLSYYQSFRDASVNFFFDWLRKGTYVFEYTLFVTQSGTYSSGYASIQCMYAPEFCAHSASNGKITILNRK